MDVELVIVPRTDGITEVKRIGRLDMLTMKEIDGRFHEETTARERSTVVGSRS